MDAITLIEPDIDYADDIWQFRQEILKTDADNEDRFAGCISLDDSRSAEEWIKTCRLRKEAQIIDVDGCRIKRYWITV